jgi:hypothetical protein
MSETAVFPSPVGHADPLGTSFPLPLHATHYPLGCELQTATNSPDVLAAVEELWGRYPRFSRERGVTLHVAAGGSAVERPTPSPPRGRGHLVSIVHSPDNFAVADLDRGFASAWLTKAVAADRAYLRYHFLEPLVYLMLDALYFAPVHAACIAFDGRAFVLCGPTGAGKTSLAYACARHGWTYLADDATHLLRRCAERIVTGRPHRIRFRHSARSLFPELSAYAPIERPNGKLDIEVETAALGLNVGYRSQAAHIVFLDRIPARGPARLRDFPRDQAQRVLEQVVCYGEEHTRAEQRAALHRFLSLPISGLTYSEPETAEAALRSLVTR